MYKYDAKLIKQSENAFDIFLNKTITVLYKLSKTVSYGVIISILERKTTELIF